MIAQHHLLRLAVVALILSACIGCDQVTKQIAQAHLKGEAVHSFCGDLFRLQYAENPGAFLGLGGHLPAALRSTLLIVVNGLIAIGLLGAVVLGWRMTPARTAGCALLLAGAIGNLIDRLRFDGLVIDFMNLGVGALRSGIFNVADMAIMVGALLLVLPTTAKSPATSPTTAKSPATSPTAAR